ncbi:lipase secretion chaperone [Vibrio tubiashii]|uniref:lipase secretion chaperone n=1 Tax=Vibrio tubiashii TaxID=29498 RepID=UPI00349EDF72
MKKTVLITISVITSIGFGAVLYLSERQQETPPPILSQADVEIDAATPKHFFDFSLSSLGEQSLDEIKKKVNKRASTESKLSNEEVLFTTYLEYKEALAELEPLQSAQLTALDLEQLHSQILTLQSRYFSEQEIKLLFEEENLLRQLAISKARITDNDLDAEQKKSLLEEQLNDMPNYIQAAEKNNLLVVNLDSVSKLDDQDKYIARSELVGEEGAKRLAELDQQRENFQATLDSYFASRDELLTSGSLSEQDKKLQIAQLREKSFDSTQLRRVEALERIHDQSR